MNLMEKYLKKHEANKGPVMADGLVIAPTSTETLPEDVKEAYEDVATIMQYDGGLFPEESEGQAWCREVCMLSFLSQWKECERFKPKPCLKLIRSQRLTI